MYQEFVDHLNIDPESIRNFKQIPFLPISFFKSHEIKTGDWKEEQIFRSSGTTGQKRSHHLVEDLSFYRENSLQIFRSLIGRPEEYYLFALLPSYLERSDASLVYMIEQWLPHFKEGSGFYLDDIADLMQQIRTRKSRGERFILIGVTFALLDLADKFPEDLSGNVIMETGGMKGRGPELVRDELHEVLSAAFDLDYIASEYGMTELMSQAYALREGKFVAPPWMKVVLRDINDPFNLNPGRSYGGVNIIDLANIHSCCFIQTDDVGSYADGGQAFRILGRLDTSDQRGCNLMLI